MVGARSIIEISSNSISVQDAVTPWKVMEEDSSVQISKKELLIANHDLPLAYVGVAS